MERYLSPSLHHIHHRKQTCLLKQEGLNQNRSLHFKSRYSSSYTSLNSYLKEFHLSEKDFDELRQALQTIFRYTQTKTLFNDKQRLTSPYLRQQSDKDDQSSLPLYTNEYFIRNGLLNHNDGPEIPDNSFQQFSYPIDLPSSSSSVNISIPLTLLSNQKYLFTALTSNFASEKCRRSQSNTIKYHDKEDDSESIIIRRNKVQAWERRNILQQNKSIEQDDQSHRSSIVQTPSTSTEEKTIVENSRSIRTCDNGDVDHLFPMVKVLAPYIIIRDSFRLNSINNRSNSVHLTNIEKRPLTDVSHPTWISAKRRSLLLTSSCTVDRNRRDDNEEQQRKKNYLLAEFESVLTQISKEQFF